MKVVNCRSILLRLTMEGDSQLDGWFTYLVFVLFAGTASFWVSTLSACIIISDSQLSQQSLKSGVAKKMIYRKLTLQVTTRNILATPIS